LGELITVLLDEGLADEAWATASSEPEQVSDSQWAQLIGVREREHAADVLGPKALRRLRDDYERAGDAAGFSEYLTGLRERQRRKYSFIAKLDAVFG
jgi:hypothetical protein